MSQITTKDIKSMFSGFFYMLLFVLGIATASYFTMDLLGFPEPPIKESSLKDRAELITEVCVKGKLVAVFNVLQKIENIEFHITQAGYSETYTVVVGNCTSGE
jgi:hypothetical protein